MSIRAQAIINAAALTHNFKRAQQLAVDKKIMAMVKANAYGHGLIAVAKALDEADYFGVACLDEAAALREAGIKQDIVVMSGFQDYEELNGILGYQLQTVVYDWRQLRLLAQLPDTQRIKIWLKIDTGMHRLGFPISEVQHAWQFLQSCGVVDQIIILTHLASANHAFDHFTQTQLQQFFTTIQHFPVLKSASNSAALMQYPESQLDIVRPGLMLYGVSPRDAGNAAVDNLQAVMTLKSRIIALHDLSEGEYVGYSSTWQATRNSKLATVSIGYGDGYPQFAPNGTPVMIRGKQVPIAGRVAMDMLSVDVTDIPDVDLGDEVILWGSELPVEKVADAIHASPYTLLTGVSPRVKRNIINSETLLSL